MFSTTKIDLRSLFQFLLNHVFGFATDGGDEGNRTLDPLLAGQVLSQLSYTPIMGYFQQSLEIEQQLVEANRVYVVLFLFHCELRRFIFQILMFSIERR